MLNHLQPNATAVILHCLRLGSNSETFQPDVPFKAVQPARRIALARTARLASPHWPKIWPCIRDSAVLVGEKKKIWRRIEGKVGEIHNDASFFVMKRIWMDECYTDSLFKQRQRIVNASYRAP